MLHMHNCLTHLHSVYEVLAGNLLRPSEKPGVYESPPTLTEVLRYSTVVTQHNMWQSWVEIKNCSIVYFIRVTEAI